jgi:hypothetical protein
MSFSDMKISLAAIPPAKPYCTWGFIGASDFTYMRGMRTFSTIRHEISVSGGA